MRRAWLRCLLQVRLPSGLLLLLDLLVLLLLEDLLLLEVLLLLLVVIVALAWLASQSSPDPLPVALQWFAIGLFSGLAALSTFRLVAHARI